MIPLTELLIFAICFLLSIVFVRSRNGKKKNGERPYPPSFRSLPIVGSLPFIKDFVNISEFFMKEGAELGPVFTVNFAGKMVVILNNLEAIEDAFVKHASGFSGRGGSWAEQKVLNKSDKGIIYKQYDPDFSRYRRLSLSILRDYGFGSKSKLEDLILTEVADLKEHIGKINGKAFNPQDLMSMSTTNVPYNMIFGKRRNLDEDPGELFVQMKRYADSTDPTLEFFPIFRFIPPHSRKFADIQDSNERVFKYLEKEVNEIIQDKTTDCFIRRYIDKEGPNYDYMQLLYTVRDFFGAASETTSTTLMWCILYLTNHPHVADRIQKEIDSVVPRDRLPSGSDQPMLPYTEATILEVIRIRSPVPVGVPHLTQHDTEVLGYFVPSDTVVISNIKSAHMNSKDWPDAETFRPERFLDKDGNLMDKNRVIPFSLGRRSCPGETLARAQLFLFISGILQSFSFQLPEGVDRISDKIHVSLIDSSLPYQVRMIARNDR